MVRGWIDYRRSGLAPPKTILDVTREYRDDEDPIEAWLDQCCDTTDPNVETPFSVLAESRKRWLEANDPDRSESSKALAALLEARGFKGKKDATTRNAVRVGIRLRQLGSEAAATKASETMMTDNQDDDIVDFLDGIAGTAQTADTDHDPARSDLVGVV
jgi:phage/plasmid-associated DNA primase